MANPTTYFGWVMPTTTDLVTDLPADFNVFGQGVDTSMQDLLGGTTGQILSKTSGTNMDFTWINNDQGDITGVTAGTGISGGGTSGAVTVTNSMATAITTAGDVIQGTGSGTFSRLGIGTVGQVLTVNSGATALEYATPASGSMTLISTTTLTGASITLSSIPQTYINLYLIIRNFRPSTDGQRLGMRFNGVTSAAYNGVSSYTGADNISFGDTYSDVTSTADNTATQSLGQLTIPDYTNTTTWKSFNGTFMTPNATTATNLNNSFSAGFHNQTAAISSITFQCNTGNLTAGTVYLYGVK